MTAAETEEALQLLDVAFKDNKPDLYLRLIKGMDAADRRPFFNQWARLIAKEPSATLREALMHDGKAPDAFGYGSITALRSDVNKLLPKGPQVIRTAGIMSDILQCEVFYRPGANPEVGFLVYDPATDRVKEVPSVKVGALEYIPPDISLIAKKVVRPPSGCEEYGDPKQLWDAIETYITSYVQIENKAFLQLCVAYVFMTWVYDHFDALPYLRATGDFGGGKTTLIQVVGLACNRPINAPGTTTPAPLYRIMEQYHGTLIIDEADFGNSEMEAAINKILTTGYKRDFPVLRCEPNTLGIQAFDPFGPKILSTRNQFRDGALESRCLSYTMPITDAKDIDRKIPFQLPPECYDDALRLRNQLLLWRFRSWSVITLDPRERLTGTEKTAEGKTEDWSMEPRINQLGLPLLACLPTAEPAHATLRASLLDSLKGYSDDLREERGVSWEGAVLAALYAEWETQRRMAMKRGSPTTSILVKELAATLRQQFPTMSNKVVTNILRRTFRFKVSTRHGARTIVVDPKQLERHARRYGCWVDVDPSIIPATVSINGPGAAASVPTRRVAMKAR